MFYPGFDVCAIVQISRSVRPYFENVDADKTGKVEVKINRDFVSFRLGIHF